MSLESLLNSTAGIYYNSTTPTGKSGGAPAMTPRNTAARCRIQTTTGREQIIDENKEIADAIGYFEASETIQHNDEVRIGSSAYLVKVILDLPGGLEHHKKVLLKRVC